MSKLSVSMAGEITLSKDPGKSMRKWREIFGVTQVELAEHLGISSSTISDYEGGRRQSPGIQVVGRFVDALLTMDKASGSQVVKRLEADAPEGGKPYEIHDFAEAVSGHDFVSKIQGKAVACKSRLADTRLYGFTVIDSVKAIVEVPVQEYLHMFGKTPNRALIFTKVSTGRSPMIAVKIGKFSVDMKPALIVLHGLEEPDQLAVKIAEAERIPLIATMMPLSDLVQGLKAYEVQ